MVTTSNYSFNYGSIRPFGELLYQISQPGESWTPEHREPFLTTFVAILNSTIRVDEKPQEFARGEEREDKS